MSVSVYKRKKLCVRVCCIVFAVTLTMCLLSLITQGFVTASYVERFFARHELSHLEIPVYTEELEPYTLPGFIADHIPVDWIHFQMLGFDIRGFSEDEIATILSDTEELVPIIASSVDRFGDYFRFGESELIFTVDDMHAILDSISESTRYSTDYSISSWDYDYAITLYETFSGYDTVPEIEETTGISFSAISLFTSVWFISILAVIAVTNICIIIVVFKKSIGRTDEFTKICNRFLIAIGITLLAIYLILTLTTSLIDPILLTPYTQGGLSWLLCPGMIGVLVGCAAQVIHRHKHPAK